jgi:Cytochrome P450
MRSARPADSIDLAVPHLNTEEDIYKGYRIPKGSIVTGNAWAMLHNEQDFPEPLAFRPERFLNPDGSLNNSVRSPCDAAFGFGRRCEDSDLVGHDANGDAENAQEKIWPCQYCG